MIPEKNKLVTQLLSTIYKDKKDPSIIRVNIHNAAHILTNFKYNLPSKVFEAKLEELLNKKLVGANITNGLNYAIADLIISLADKMHVSDEQIAKYLSEHNSEEDVKKIHDDIKKWRKQYYGSMDKADKQALIDALSDKIRPDVLDEIRRA